MAAPPRRGIGPIAAREERYFWLFISPWILGFVILTAGSMLLSFYWSFTNFDLLTPVKWAGIENYRSILTGYDSRLFLQALKVTTIYTFTSVPLQLVGGFAVALLMNQKIRGINLYRTLYYLPAVTAGVATALLWIYMFNPEFGLINWTLSLFGIQGPKWILSESWALPSLILMSLWGFGSPMVIYLAGFQSIPEHLYEAGKIDGAGPFSLFRHVTLPMMTPIIFFNLVVSIIGTFQVFTSGYVITRGGPANATLFYVLHLYNTAFVNFHMGTASALAWILFAIIMMLTLIQVRLAAGWVYYEGGLR